ncbi:MAG: CPBP family intramembrane metalloprotease [Promethearchaeota archaeon]|nr:MAG: CPBP family intramembrane metalloprotease [Candidatus Lokiarchaeota archaeon]
MVIELGKDPWILIGLTLAELFLLLIPAIIASRVENTSIKDELEFMGIKKTEDSISKIFLKITIGIILGFVFFFISGYIAIIFRNWIVEKIFGKRFVKEGQQGSISTEPMKYSPIQIIIIIILQFMIVALCEEAFFRGFIIKKMEKRVNTVSGILFSSMCFAIYHTPPFLVPITTIITYFGYFFTFGILLSIIFKFFKNSLILCIIAHGLFNVLIIIF